MFFRKISILFFLFCALNARADEDVLRLKILKHNDIVINKNEFTVDSSKLFFNTSFVHNLESVSFSTHILKKRLQSKNYNYFFYILGILFILSVIRYSTNINFNFQFTQFIKLRSKTQNEYSLFKTAIIHSIFILIMSYLVFTLFFSKLDFVKLANSTIFFNIIIVFTTIFILKNFINTFVLSMLGNNSRLIKIKNIWLDYMYIFVSMSLPLILLSTIVDNSAQNIILVCVSIIMIILYLFILFKIVYTNFQLIVLNVFKFIIYFYSVEIIPILLSVKYFKSFLL